jgi:hypothetical protein
MAASPETPSLQIRPGGGDGGPDRHDRSETIVATMYVALSVLRGVASLAEGRLGVWKTRQRPRSLKVKALHAHEDHRSPARWRDHRGSVSRDVSDESQLGDRRGRGRGLRLSVRRQAVRSGRLRAHVRRVPRQRDLQRERQLLLVRARVFRQAVRTRRLRRQLRIVHGQPIVQLERSVRVLHAELFDHGLRPGRLWRFVRNVSFGTNLRLGRSLHSVYADLHRQGVRRRRLRRDLRHLPVGRAVLIGAMHGMLLNVLLPELFGQGLRPRRLRRHLWCMSNGPDLPRQQRPVRHLHAELQRQAVRQ